MNPEILERLTLDHALGLLSPDVEALLAEHLAAHPELAHLGAEFSETVQLAKSALKTDAAHPPLPARHRLRSPRQISARGLPLAAAFLLGAGLTFALGSLRSPRNETPVSVSATTDGASAAVEENPPPELERQVRSLPFWSMQRAALLAAARQSENK